MKTFEERYTAWIDGQLTGEALTTFEAELERRAEAGDAAAEVDKAGALQLRALLKEHLQAPALTNADFFTHQMHERIDAEIHRAAIRREASAKPAWKFPAFAWPFGRLVGVGGACLFVAAALYYGLVPSHGPDAGKTVADSSPAQPRGEQVAKADAPSAPASNAPVERASDNQVAFNNVPTPTPIDLNANEDIKVVPSAASTTSATTLHYNNASVLWVSGLPYLPNVSDASPAPAGEPAPVPAPAASSPPATVP